MNVYKSEFFKIGIAVFIAITVFVLSLALFSITQAALLGVVSFLVTLWTNEALPLGVVSLLPIILFPSFSILSTSETTANYSNPIIFLFLGGFLLAIAVEKTDLHKYIAHKILEFFPSTPRGIIFSLTITSGLLSSLLSNTTTTLLLIAIALFLSQDRALKMRFSLAIAYGASVGGILTPVGTPPNLIMLGFMQENRIEAVPFLKWMFLSAPLVLIMFFVVASLLSFGVKDLKIELKKEKRFLDTKQKKVLFLLGSLTSLLLLNSRFEPYWSGLGLNESVILLGFGLLLFAPPFSILEWMDDKAKIPFRIMFLFGAGFSIAAAFSKTHLADEIASSLISMTDMPSFALLLLIALLITFTTEITSNTALISIMLPVVYSVAVQTGLDTTLFMMVATVCASYAFMLPIATAPNAIAMSSGVVGVRDMIRYGFVLNIAGIAFIVIIAEFFWRRFL